MKGAGIKDDIFLYLFLGKLEMIKGGQTEVDTWKGSKDAHVMLCVHGIYL